MTIVKEFVSETFLHQRISHIRFGLLSAADVVRLAEIPVVNRELYQMPGRTPFPQGCLDRRFGTSEKNVKCETCQKEMKDCVGHYGVIPLRLPVFHIGYFRNIVTVLQAICKHCSRVLLSEADRKFFLARLSHPRIEVLQRRVIFKLVCDKAKRMALCPHCGGYNGGVKKVGALKIVHQRYKSRPMLSGVEEFKESFSAASAFNPELSGSLGRAQEDISPLRAKILFDRIPEIDLKLLDMNPESGHPSHFLVTHVLVPPVCIRPSVCMDASMGSNEDDLTMKLAEIVHINNILDNAMKRGSSIQVIMEDWEFLQLQCAIFINSELPGVPSTLAPGNPIRGLCQRLKGKQGRFRGNLSGKRVDFSSRTVISPDPNLKIFEVGVPRHVAQTLTFPARVTDINREELVQAVIRGPDSHPGANFVETELGKRFLKYGDRRACAASLRVGDIVERHLIDGDVVLFNRQPSLHKMSIMAHRVKVVPHRTFSFNVCACSPYNADFDGDEMNLHVPQTEEARAEAASLISVLENIITPRNGQPLISPTQDLLTASYLLSRKDTFLGRHKFWQMCAHFLDLYGSDRLRTIVLPPPAIVKPVELWTGKQVFSTMLKASLPVGENNVYVELQTRSYSQKGNEMCPNDGYLVIHAAELLCGVLDKSSLGSGNRAGLFAILLRDFSPTVCADCMVRLSWLATRFLMNRGFSIGIDDVEPSEHLKMRKAELIDGHYAACDRYIEQFRRGELQPSPGCDAEETLEAKITGELSQIREDAGKLCIRELRQLNAPLVMSMCGSKGSMINISQMVAAVGQQTIGGARIQNGFVDRTLPIFAPGSRTPGAKGFVANSFYSGLSPTEFFFHSMAGREGLVDTAVKTSETGYMQRRLMKAMEDLAIHYDGTVRALHGQVVQLSYGQDRLDPTSMEVKASPVAFNRALSRAQHDRSSWSEPRLAPNEIEKIAKRCSKMEMFANCSVEFKMELESFLMRIAKKLEGLQKSFGDAAVVRKVFQLTRRQLDVFLATCAERYSRSFCDPGTAVGAIGAQSLGEPATQMTLRTFHFAGVSSMNITLGVPRIKEIINATKSLSTPIVTAPLVFDSDVKAARIVKGRIEKTLLSGVAEVMEIVYTPTEAYMHIILDKGTIDALQLDIDAVTVRACILGTPRIKVKEKHVDVRGPYELIVTPFDCSRTKMTFALHYLKTVIPSVIVKGYEAIDRAVINQIENKEGHYNLLVEGTDVMAVVGTPGVRFEGVRSNDFIRMFEIFGIEAARFRIIEEIQYTMQAHGMSVDLKHIMLLADLMTFRGEILGITRFGIGKMKENVLTLASFEKTTDHLFDAAAHGRVDEMDGVSECIIVGVPIRVGTGLFEVLQPNPGITAFPKRQPLVMHSNDVVFAT